jgi:hypothetical protein
MVGSVWAGDGSSLTGRDITPCRAFERRSREIMGITPPPSALLKMSLFVSDPLFR